MINGVRVRVTVSGRMDGEDILECVFVVMEGSDEARNEGGWPRKHV